MQADQIFDSSQIVSEIQFQGLNAASNGNQNFLWASDINQKQYYSSEIFSSFNQISMKNPFNINQENLKGYSSIIDASFFNSSTEDPLYSVLHFMRGKSEDWNPCEDRETKKEFHESQFSLHLEEGSAENHFEQEEMKTSLHNSSTLQPERQESEGQLNSSKGKSATKNITKNMGKLLLKWLWGNRSILRRQLQSNSSIWDQFIGQVKEWKKQNNLTRKFLRERWHGADQISRLFRILSARFFRCECLASVAESNIDDKWLHLKKRTRFLDGTSRPEALDALN